MHGFDHLRPTADQAANVFFGRYGEMGLHLSIQDVERAGNEPQGRGRLPPDSVACFQIVQHHQGKVGQQLLSIHRWEFAVWRSIGRQGLAGLRRELKEFRRLVRVTDCQINRTKCADQKAGLLRLGVEGEAGERPSG